MHILAMEQREAYAKSLPNARAKQFRELKIEAILDTPVNIVVTADPTRGGRHTLGRHTQPQMAPYSSALAVENLWLAARAEGLGVGWVSFFDERQMVTELGLPEHLEAVAYFLGGGAVCNAFANQVGAEVCVVDVGVASELPSTPGLLPRKVRLGTADFTVGPAMSREEALRAVEIGIETARDLVAAGNK